MFSGHQLSLVLAMALSAVLLVVGVAACGSSDDTSADATSGATDAAAATSAADFGGMDGLLAAQDGGRAQRHRPAPGLGELRRDHQGIRDKYGIKVNSAQPDAASQDEINAANQQKGRSTAPDVFDLGQSVALANTAIFAPYKVATLDRSPTT